MLRQRPTTGSTEVGRRTTSTTGRGAGTRRGRRSRGSGGRCSGATRRRRRRGARDELSSFLWGKDFSMGLLLRRVPSALSGQWSAFSTFCYVKFITGFRLALTIEEAYRGKTLTPDRRFRHKKTGFKANPSMSVTASPKYFGSGRVRACWQVSSITLLPGSQTAAARHQSSNISSTRRQPTAVDDVTLSESNPQR